MAASARVTQPLLTSIALPSPYFPYCVLFEAHNDTLLPLQLILIIINDLQGFHKLLQPTAIRLYIMSNSMIDKLENLNYAQHVIVTC